MSLFLQHTWWYTTVIQTSLYSLESSYPIFKVKFSQEALSILTKLLTEQSLFSQLWEASTLCINIKSHAADMILMYQIYDVSSCFDDLSNWRQHMTGLCSSQSVKAKCLLYKLFLQSGSTPEANPPLLAFWMSRDNITTVQNYKDDASVKGKNSNKQKSKEFQTPYRRPRLA